MEKMIVEYKLGVSPGTDPHGIAKDICLEQTVELAESLVTDPHIQEHVIGKIMALEEGDDGRYLAKITYDWRVTGLEIPQFLNVLFGNISLKRGVFLEDFTLHDDLFPGPGHGIAGLRKITGASRGPLLCTALKPMGSNTQTLANMAHDLALGGLQIIKDDHGLANQPYSPFRERVAAVAEAVDRANDKTGNRCLYFPNFAPKIESLTTSIDYCKQHRIKGLLVSPFLIGLDMVRYLAQNTDFALMLHPACSGALFADKHHGARPALILGKLFRALGADSSIYPNVGGRFIFDSATCREINRELTRDLPGFKSAFPVPAGGMSLERIPEMRADYGEDLIFLIGGGLLRKSSNLTEAARMFKDRVIQA